MEKLLISLATVDYNTTAIGGTWVLNTLTNGELCVFDQEGTAVDMLAPAIATDTFTVAVGRTSGSTEQSNPIDIQSLSWNKEDYTAPVAKTMHIGDEAVGAATYGLHIPTPLISGSVASISIMEKDPEKHFDASRINDVEYVVQDGDTTTTVQAGLVAAINANAGAAAVCAAAVASAVVGNLGFTLTGATAGVDFTATVGGILADADVLQYQNVNGTYTAGYTDATAIVNGYGTAAQLTALELAYSPHRGNINSNLFGSVLYSEATAVVAGATYTQYTLVWRHTSNNALVNEPNVQQTLVVAIPSGESGAAESITAMDNILASL